MVAGDDDDHLRPNMDATRNDQPQRQFIENRPHSAYDNLSSTMATSPTSMNVKRNHHPSQLPPHQVQQTNEHDYSFGDISFKFDDLPKQHRHNRQQYQSDPINNNNNHQTSDTNNLQGCHKPFIANHNNNNSNQNYTTNNNTPVTGDATIANSHNGYNNGSNNSGFISADKSAQFGSSLTTPQSSSRAQYENVSETVKLRNSLSNSRKPVISDAKSSFFGLGQAIPPQQEHHQQSVGHPSSDRLYQLSGIMNGDRAPLITVTHNVPIVSSPKSNGQYQNIPSNSACFGQSPAMSPQSVQMSHDYQHERLHDPSLESSHQQDPQQQYQDVYDSNDPTTANSSKNFMEANKRTNEQHPSQAVYMTTTVPQNIKGSNIAGRHTPTRSSLRHSRMIVVNKNYQAPRKPNPLDLNYPLLAKIFLIIQLMIGFCVTSLALWILLWAPNTRTRDNPYWSGLTLLLAGILGLILIEFRRIPRHKMREHCFTFIRMNSMTVSLLAVVVSFGAFLFAALHLDNVTSAQTTCMPASIFAGNAACICLFGAPNGTNHMALKSAGGEGEITAGGFEFHYRDLNCDEVTGAWKYILITSTVLNMLGFMVSFLYLLCLCFPRKKKTTYAPVRSRL